LIYQLNGQVFINRESPLTSSEAFGIRKTIVPTFPFTNHFGGMYVETQNSAIGKPFYGYAIDSTIKAYHYYDGFDAGWHLFNTTKLLSVWKDSLSYITTSGDRLFFPGHRVSYGKNGNTILGFRATLTDVPENIGNTVIGWNSARDMISGVSNTVVGFFAGEDLTDGDFNTFLGTDAGRSNTTGRKNTYLGYWAGRNTGVNSEGNVFLGYRAGQNEPGNNKLYISNSETSVPLIYGDFNTGDIKFNADAEVTGNITISGTANINGVTTISNRLNSEEIIINDSNPYLEFKQLGSSKYYFQYQNGNDQFVLHESGTGVVLKVKDGEIYFPQLTNLAGKSLKINSTTGKLEVDPDPTIFTYYGTEFQNHSNEDKIKDVTKDLINGMTINKIVCRYDWASLGSPSPVLLSRIQKSSGTASVVYVIPSPGPGVYNAEFSSTTSPHVVNTDQYNYYLVTESLLTTIMEVRIE
jgi:hypothetical protein